MFYFCNIFKLAFSPVVKYHPLILVYTYLVFIIYLIMFYEYVMICGLLCILIFGRCKYNTGLYVDHLDSKRKIYDNRSQRISSTRSSRSYRSYFEPPFHRFFGRYTVLIACNTLTTKLHQEDLFQLLLFSFPCIIINYY